MAHIDGEDERSVVKNTEAMVLEMKKSKPDLQVIKEKMRRTGTLRQKLCLESTTTKTLEKFPALEMRAFVSLLLAILQQNIGSIVNLCHCFKHQY